MEGAKRALIVVDHGCVSRPQYIELLDALDRLGIHTIGLLCRRFDSKPVELWNLDNLEPVEMEEIRTLVQKVVR